jgi:predicted dehydrogenase
MRKVRWGIVGAGRISNTFAKDMQFVTKGEIKAVAARSLDSARLFAAKYNIPQAYGGYQALFDDPDIDAVYIATPHTCHLQNAKDAMLAGKAVMCEKPFTVTPNECKELIEIANKTNTYLMEAMWTHFLPAIQKAQAWVAEGRIGTVHHIKADFGYPQLPYDETKREYDKNLAGGCLLEMGIYPVALSHLFMQKDPLSMSVVARKAPNGVEDDLSMLFNYGDAVATLGTSFRCKLQNWAYIIGEKGYIAIPDFWRAKECFLYELDTQVESFSDERKSDGFDYQINSVCDDVLNNKKQSSIVPLASSLQFQELIARVRANFYER